MCKSTHQALRVLFVTCCLTVFPAPALQSCSKLENSCHQFDIESNTSFNVLKDQICSLPTKELILSPPPKFATEPSNQTVISDTDYVTFECSITSSYDAHSSISWEHDDMEISNSEEFNITHTATSSDLRVKVGVSTEGVYRCIVTNQLIGYNITSRYGNLQVDNCSEHGWIDNVLPPNHSSDKAVDIVLAKGGSTILECNPDLTLFSSSTAWLRDYNTTLDNTHTFLPSGGLLIRDYDPPPSGVAHYRCIITSLSCRKPPVRDFYVSTNEGEPVIVAPSNQTVVVGSSNISFYCITNSKSRSAWYKDGQLLDSDSSLNWKLFGSKNEVLVLSSVTMETRGVFSCANDSGYTLSVLLTVLAPPTSAGIQVAGHTPLNNTLVLPRHSDQNYSLHLTCSADSQSGDTDTTFSWFFGGQPITVARPVGVVYTGGGPMLSVTGRNVFGSYQCVAGSRAGSALATLYVYEGATAMDKPPPPSAVSLILDREVAQHRTPKTYLYHFKINPPGTFDLSQNYAVEMIAFRSGNGYYSNCSCELSQNIGANNVGTGEFLVKEYVGYQLYFRAAVLNSDGQKSDYIPYFNNSKCGTFVEQVALPPPTDLVWAPVLQEGSWDVTLSWSRPATTHDQPPDYLTNLTIECEGRDKEEPLNLESRSITSYSLTLPCCTACNWTVTFTADDGTFPSSQTRRDRTEAIRPTQPPTLNSVTRVQSQTDNQTLELDFTLPPKDISCGPTKYTVLYSGQEMPSISLSSCGLVRQASPETVGSYLCLVSVPRDLCWKSLDVSVKFGNDKDWSDWSNSTRVPGVTQDDLAGFSGLNVTQVTSSSLTLKLQITSGLACLLRNNPDAILQLCVSPPLNQLTCQNVSYTNQPIPIPKLKGGTEYHIEAVLRVAGVGEQRRDVMTTTRVGVPSEPPQNLDTIQTGNKLNVSWEAPSEESSNGDVDHYNLTITSPEGEMRLSVNKTVYTMEHYSASVQYTVVVRACTVAGCGPETRKTVPKKTVQPATPANPGSSGLWAAAVTGGVLVLLVGVIVITVGIVCVRRYRKRREFRRRKLDRRTLLHTEADETLNDEDLVSVRGADGTAGSIHSDHTTDFNKLHSMDQMDSNSKCQEFITSRMENPYPRNVKEIDEDIEHDNPLSRGDMGCVTIRAEVHESTPESVLGGEGAIEGQTRTSPMKDHRRQKPRKKRSRRERPEDTVALIDSEQEDEAECVDHSQSPVRRDWNKYLEQSPCGINSPPSPQHSEYNMISLNSLRPRDIEQITSSSGLITREREDSVCSTQIDAITQKAPLQTQAILQSTSSGYVMDECTMVTEAPTPQQDVLTDSLNHSQSNSLGTPFLMLSANTQTSSLDRTLNESTELKYCKNPILSKSSQETHNDTSSSQGYISLPAPSQISPSPCTSNFSTDLPDELTQDRLSQDSSVFDETLDTHKITFSPRRTVMSSGICSTSSDTSRSDYVENGEQSYLQERRVLGFSRPQLISEGYVSAPPTPSCQGEHFTLPVSRTGSGAVVADEGVPVNGGVSDSSDSSSSVHFEPPQLPKELCPQSPSISQSPSPTAQMLSPEELSPTLRYSTTLSHNPLTSEPHRQYFNTEDVDLESIKLTMDEATLVSTQTQS